MACKEGQFNVANFKAFGIKLNAKNVNGMTLNVVEFKAFGINLNVRNVDGVTHFDFVRLLDTLKQRRERLKLRFTPLI